MQVTVSSSSLRLPLRAARAPAGRAVLPSAGQRRVGRGGQKGRLQVRCNVKKGDGTKTISTNRKARFNYEILDTFEAGIVLTGTEVKSLRAGKCDLGESFARIRNGEVFLLRSYIPKWTTANAFDQHEERGTRKLLLHKREIKKLLQKVQEKGLTLVPLRMYFKEGRVKVLLAVGRGKDKADKRQTIKERDGKRAVSRMAKVM